MDPTNAEGVRSILVELFGAFGEGSELRPAGMGPATHIPGELKDLEQVACLALAAAARSLEHLAGREFVS